MTPTSSGRPVRLEDYLAAHPRLADADGPPVELICEEFHVRKSHGEAVDLSDLCRRFPGRARDIWRWLGGAERTMRGRNPGVRATIRPRGARPAAAAAPFATPVPLRR